MALFDWLRKGNTISKQEHPISSVENYFDKTQIEPIVKDGKEYTSFHFIVGSICLEATKIGTDRFVSIEANYPQEEEYCYRESDFCEDINAFEDLIASNMRDINTVLNFYFRQHIANYGRLVDTDLYRSIAIYIYYMEIHGRFLGIMETPLSRPEKYRISESLSEKIIELYKESFFITKYKLLNGESIPYLEKYNH